MTAIISFDAISHRTYKAISGAIGHYRYPSDEEYAAKHKSFYNSLVGRRNKQKISEVISEVYAFLNTRISEHADPADYYFRLFLRMELKKETAEIIGNPSFDIDVFRHLGKIGGKHSNVGNYSLNTVLVDKERSPISPIFKKGLSKARTETGLIGFLVYDSYSKAPAEIRGKTTKDAYYLIIDEEVNKIQAAIDPKTNDVVYKTKENNNTIEFRSEDDVFNYVLKKIKVIPKIVGSETGLSLVDKEIMGITSELEKLENEQQTDIIAQLGIEHTLKELFDELDSFKARANTEKAKTKQRYRATLEEIDSEFKSLKIDLEIQESEITRLNEERTKKEITDDYYSTCRVKGLKAIAIIKSKLVELQKNLKEQYVEEIAAFVAAKGKGE